MCGTVAWLQAKPVEMMSNSTLPLGFLHSNTELVTCGQLFYDQKDSCVPSQAL
jgi:hypothetical protein